MSIRILLATAAALATIGAGPAMATEHNGTDHANNSNNGKDKSDNGSNGKTPPGDPCGSGPGVGAGNPCHGNEGNDGANGNSNHGFAPIDLDIDALPGHGAYITQIGDYNDASVRQTNARSLAIVYQHGDENAASVTQNGLDRDFAKVAQLGDDNRATVKQSGLGPNIGWVAQGGWHNVAKLTQNSDGGENGAILAQVGANNHISLKQDGSDNEAVLTQTGSGNEMSASQSGENNQLVWTQLGDNLSHAAVTQDGGSSMYITQTSWGGGTGH